MSMTDPVTKEVTITHETQSVTVSENSEFADVLYQREIKDTKTGELIVRDVVRMQVPVYQAKSSIDDAIAKAAKAGGTDG
jgi:hypothetical protein